MKLSLGGLGLIFNLSFSPNTTTSPPPPKKLYFACMLEHFTSFLKPTNFNSDVGVQGLRTNPSPPKEKFQIYRTPVDYMYKCTYLHMLYMGYYNTIDYYLHRTAGGSTTEVHGEVIHILMDWSSVSASDCCSII